MPIIRPFQPEDIVEVTLIDQAEFGSADYPMFFFRQAYDLFGDMFLVAEGQDGAIAGYILGGVSCTNTEEAWILSLVVRSTDRKMGHGTSLLRAFLQNVGTRRVRRVKLSVSPANTQAIRFYEQLHFATVERAIDYCGPGESRLIMQRILGEADQRNNQTWQSW